MKRFLRSVERAVAFHCDDRVSDHELRTDRGTNVENACVNAGPVDDVLRPAVTGPGHNAKHVLHAERDTGPVVGLHLRHGYDEIRHQDCSREPQVTKTGIVCLELCFDEFVAIEIDEGNLSVQELIGEASFVNKEVCVAMMTRPFSHSDGCGAQSEEGFSCGADESWVGVHRSSGNVFDDVGFEQNGFLTNL